MTQHTVQRRFLGNHLQDGLQVCWLLIVNVDLMISIILYIHQYNIYYSDNESFVSHMFANNQLKDMSFMYHGCGLELHELE